MISAATFGWKWNASGPTPLWAVRSGLISRYGSIDDSEGGSTGRHQVEVALRSTGSGAGGWDLRAHAVKYDFELFPNFTFFLRDPTEGDGIRQADDRWMLGAQARYRAPVVVAGLRGWPSTGLGARSDWIDVRLDGLVRRRLLDPRVDARVRERHGFAWLR